MIAVISTVRLSYKALRANSLYFTPKMFVLRANSRGYMLVRQRDVGSVAYLSFTDLN